MEGKISCISTQGDIIAKFPKAPKRGSLVFDNQKKDIGTVTWIFGPVEEPYVEISTDERPSRSVSMIDRKIYVEEK